MQSWLEGRTWIGKGAQATAMTAGLRILSSKADSNTWESFTRSEPKLESVHQESPRSDIFRKRATKPLLKQKHRQKHLTWANEKNNRTVAQWPKSSFQIKVRLAFQFEIKVWSLEEEWRGTEFKLLEVQCEVSEVSDDLRCRDVCWSWSVVFYQVQSQCSRLPGDFGALYASICWQALWRCWFPFQHYLAPAYSAKSTSKWFADHDSTVLDWPANMSCREAHMESMGYFQEKDEKQLIQQSRRAEGCATGWSLPCHTSLMLEFVLQEPWPSTECRNEHTIKNLNISVVQILFLIDLRKYYNILRYWIFDFHEL